MIIGIVFSGFIVCIYLYKNYACNRPCALGPCALSCIKKWHKKEYIIIIIIIIIKEEAHQVLSDKFTYLL